MQAPERRHLAIIRDQAQLMHTFDEYRQLLGGGEVGEAQERYWRGPLKGVDMELVL